MAFIKKTWLARLGTGLNKFTVNGGNKVALDSAPDTITQEGTPLSAQNMNDLEGRIEAGFIAVESSLTGVVMWFTGNTGQIPIGYLVCNGQEVSRTTYARLFAVIGTKYGAGDGNTTFNLPDLSDGNGRFIRAGFTDTNIGSKQDDAIRNITGTTGAQALDKDFWNQGAFYTLETSVVEIAQQQGYYDNLIGFNANSDSYSYGNPMAGHANGIDIHPYNIAFLPLIAY